MEVKSFVYVKKVNGDSVLLSAKDYVTFSSCWMLELQHCIIVCTEEAVRPVSLHVPNTTATIAGTET